VPDRSIAVPADREASEAPQRGAAEELPESVLNYRAEAECQLRLDGSRLSAAERDLADGATDLAPTSLSEMPATL